MKFFDHPNKWFMAKFDRHEPIIQDHTGMNIAKTCKRKYFYRIVLGFTPRQEKYQTVFDFGTAYHKLKEVLRRTGNIGEAIQAASRLPILSPSPVKKFHYLTKAALMKAAHVANEQWEKDQEQKKIKLIPDMIEQPLNVQLPDGSFVGGRLDAGVEWMGQIWDEDDKTSSKDEEGFASQKAVDDQTTRYIYMLTKLHGDDIGGIIFNVLHHNYTEKNGLKMWLNKVTFQRTDRQLKEWEREQIHFNKELALARESDIWVKEEHNCAWCPFMWVCKQSNEAAQMAKLESDFKLQPWDFEKVEQGGE